MKMVKVMIVMVVIIITMVLMETVRRNQSYYGRPTTQTNMSGSGGEGDDGVGNDIAQPAAAAPPFNIVNNSNVYIHLDRPLTLTMSSSDENILRERKKLGLRVAVCVIGQVQRLEMATKSANIVAANVDYGADVAVFGVLDGGRASFTNKVISGTLDNCYKDDIEYKEFAEQFVKQFKENGAFHVDVEVNTHPEEFRVTNDMAEMFRNYRAQKERSKRVQNHLRMFKHDNQCGKNIEQFEQDWGQRFDVVLRMRECALVLKPMDLTALASQYKNCLKNAEGGCVLSKACNNAGGYSDKFWVIPRAKLTGALISNFEDLISAESRLRSKGPTNSETLLQTMWHNHGVYSTQTPLEDLPVVDARCETIGDLVKPPVFIPVPELKDCSKFKKQKETKQKKSEQKTKNNVFQQYETIKYRVTVKLMDPNLLQDATPDIETWQESSYGFYYPSPFGGIDGESYLTMVRNRSLVPPVLGDSVRLAIYTKTKAGAPNSVYVGTEVGESSAFNIPMGPRFQWRGSASPSSAVYNFRKPNGDEFGAYVINTEDGAILAEVDKPIFSLDKAGNRATSLDFARVLCFSADGTYGYQVSPDAALDKLREPRIPDDNGIWAIDLAKAVSRVPVVSRLVMTARKVVDFMVSEGLPIYSGRRKASSDWLSQDKCYVWLEQPRLDDSGERILFMARAKCVETLTTVKEAQEFFYINLGIFTVGWEGTNLWYANSAPVSHFDFVGTGPGELLLCGNEGMLLTQDRVGGGVMYSSGLFTPETKHGHSDKYAGHCTLSRSRPGMIATDTSCTKCVVTCKESTSFCSKGDTGRHLGILNTTAKELKVFGLFRADVSIPEPLFIDLHPRFSSNDRYLSIDSAHDISKGPRQYIIDLRSATMSAG